MARTKGMSILRLGIIGSFLVLFSMAVQVLAASEQGNELSSQTDLLDIPIEKLLEMDVEVFVASKKEESQFEAPGVVVVVPRSEFEMYGDRNLYQLLQRQPSVYTYSPFFYTDNAAGFRGDVITGGATHTLVLLNGRPIRESAQGHNLPVYLTFPLASLDSIELVRGPGSVLYGTNAFTGVVNLKTRSIPDKNKYSISAMTGCYGYYETTATAAGRSGKLGYITAVRASGQRGFPYHLVDAAGVSGESNKHERSVSATAHLKYGNFTFDIFGSEMELFQMGVAPFWSVPQHEIRNRRLFVNAGYQIPLDEQASLEFNLTYNLQENTLSSPDITRIGTNTSDVLGEITLFVSPVDKLNVILGFLQEYRANYQPDDEYYKSIVAYRYSPRAIYAQGDYKLFDDSLKLIAGTQWNESPLGDSGLVSRYGLIFAPWENWGVKLLRGEAFRGPVTLESDLYDPPILVGNKNLKPEQVITHDAQLFYHDEKTYAAITYFHSVIKQQIIFDTPPTTYINGGRQRFEGVELEFKRFLTSHWHILGSFMHQENDGDKGRVNHTVVPENMFKFGTGYSWDWGTASLFYTFFGEPPKVFSPLVVNPEPEEISLVSVNVQIDPSRWLDIPKGRAVLMFKIENLFDEEIYVPTLAYIGSPNSFPYGPGRMFYGGLKINF